MFRNFFVFDISGITDTILTAELRAYNPSQSVVGDSGDGYRSLDPTEIYRMFDVSTDIGVLTGGTGGVSAFNDLGSGTTYGTRPFSSSDNGTIVSIMLNGNVVKDLNAASGLFALGGVITSLASGQGHEHMFGFTAGPTGGTMPVSDFTRELFITTRGSQSVPVPSTLLLFGSGLVGLVAWWWRQGRVTTFS